MLLPLHITAARCPNKLALADEAGQRCRARAFRDVVRVGVDAHCIGDLEFAEAKNARRAGADDFGCSKQVCSGLFAGGSRIRTLGPPRADLETRGVLEKPG